MLEKEVERLTNHITKSSAYVGKKVILMGYSYVLAGESVLENKLRYVEYKRKVDYFKTLGLNIANKLPSYETFLTMVTSPKYDSQKAITNYLGELEKLAFMGVLTKNALIDYSLYVPYYTSSSEEYNKYDDLCKKEMEVLYSLGVPPILSDTILDNVTFTANIEGKKEVKGLTTPTYVIQYSLGVSGCVKEIQLVLVDDNTKALMYISANKGTSDNTYYLRYSPKLDQDVITMELSSEETINGLLGRIIKKINKKLYPLKGEVLKKELENLDYITLP